MILIRRFLHTAHQAATVTMMSLRSWKPLLLSHSPQGLESLATTIEAVAAVPSFASSKDDKGRRNNLHRFSWGCWDSDFSIKYGLQCQGTFASGKWSQQWFYWKVTLNVSSKQWWKWKCWIGQQQTQSQYQRQHCSPFASQGKWFVCFAD